MDDEEYWNNIEEQINHARSQIFFHQQRIFFFELIIAVIGVGFLINLLPQLFMMLGLNKKTYNIAQHMFLD